MRCRHRAENSLGREIKSFFALYAASYFDADELRDFAGDAWLALMLCQIIPAAITGTIAAAGVAQDAFAPSNFLLESNTSHAVWWRASAMRKHLRYTRRSIRLSASNPLVESLEVRRLLASVSINADQVVRTVTDDMLGVNLAWWDFPLNNSPTQTANLTAAAGFTGFRFPGGASADEFHLTEPPSYNGRGTVATLAKFVAQTGEHGMFTLDYGSGSPQEAAATLAYLNAPVGSNVSIGTGQTWSTSSNAWVNYDFQNSGYWASLRAANPIPGDPDHLNHLRIGRAAPFAFGFYEVGNENYGSWETDHHTPAHNPTPYVAFAKQFSGLAAQIDPSIAIGLVASAGTENNNWTRNVLDRCVAEGFTPSFIVDHNYVYGPGQENDNTLLHSVSNPGNYVGWASRAAPIAR